MLETRQTAASVSDRDIATLDTFAEKNLQTTQISEVMIASPTLVQRGAIYLISAAMGFSFCLLYFGKVPIWVSARGKISSAQMSDGVVDRVLLGVKSTPLVVKAVVPNKDIGFVRVGMMARIKVDAYPFGHGTLSARVRQIVPNVGNEDNFTITLELLQDSIKADEHDIKLFSGLTVQAEFQTRNQRLFELLFNK